MYRIWEVFIGLILLGLLIWRVPQLVELERTGTRTTGIVTDYKGRGRTTPAVRWGEEDRQQEATGWDTLWLWRYYDVGAVVPLIVKGELIPVVGGPVVRWWQNLVLFAVFLGLVRDLFTPRRRHED